MRAIKLKIKASLGPLRLRELYDNLNLVYRDLRQRRVNGEFGDPSEFGESELIGLIDEVVRDQLFVVNSTVCTEHDFELMETR